MGLMLCADISFCDVADRLMFLDLKADRYFCLGPLAEAGFRAAISGAQPAGEWEAALRPLIQCGILVPTTDDCRPSACSGSASPVKSFLDCGYAEVPIRLRMAALKDLAVAQLALKFRSLSAVLGALRLQKSRAAYHSDAMSASAQDVAAAFEWSSRIVRTHDRCLPRSIAVAQRLASLNIAAELVIGVSLYPFAAHSWVQCGTALVNDSPDGVRHFTPILTI